MIRIVKEESEILKLITGFKDYVFYEPSHLYTYKGEPVKYSVTKYIDRFSEPFDREGISAKYAKKHGLSQEEVLKSWDKKGKISALAGTAIHSYLENAKRGKKINIDYSFAENENLREEVEERVKILLPQAKAFHEDTIGKLIPIQLEYTVGIENIIAGNIDLLCWNEYAQQFQIWDYKNLKEFTTKNYFNKWALGSFDKLPECNLTHYSIQLNTYRAIIERQLGIKIGGCYLVHFNYVKPEKGFQIYPCLDLIDECQYEIDKLIEECKNC